MNKYLYLFTLFVFCSLFIVGCGPSEAETATMATSAPVPLLQGETIVVTSTADSGPGSLRRALYDAQPYDTITFDPAVFPPEAPVTILLKNEVNGSALPHVFQGDLTIDASNAGVILDGSAIQGDWVSGLEIYSSGNIVRGLQIINFTGSGIVVCHASDNTIGGDRGIGIGPLGQGNLASMNAIGIDLCDSGSYNTITGNIVGTDYTETHNWGNTSHGILLENGMTFNTIGPDNIVAYNGLRGVEISGNKSFGNTVTQNSIYANWVGIRLWDGGNTMLNHPLFSDFEVTAGTVTGSACANCIIEIFSTNRNEGDVYEGQTEANSMGSFTYDHGASFTGPYLTATATDADGNTSEFSPFGFTYELFQVVNTNSIIKFESKQSSELEDNRIGINFQDLWRLEPEVFPDGELNVDHILNQGVTRARFAITRIDSEIVHWDKPENSINPKHDEFITSLADNGITITYVLSFWDKEYVAQGGVVSSPRFKTEEEIQRYLDFVRFIVHHFKDRVEYYEIWNEPNIRSAPNLIQWIEVEDYINLVKRVVPVIRQEYPEAKIVVGGVSYIREEYVYDYLLGVIKSDDIMPLVDVVSWHGMYGTSPEYDYHRQYYYDYPSIVREIKETASAHGFNGEFVSDELSWLLPTTPGHLETYYSETKCAKYYARGIIMHLGMDVAVSQFYAVHHEHPMQIVNTIRNLTTIMAGTEPSNLTVDIQSEAPNIMSYSFSLPNGDSLIALWTDGVAVDVDLGVKSTIIFPGLSAQKTTAIDVVYGFEKQLITDIEDGNLIVRDLLVKDYPIILRISGASSP